MSLTFDGRVSISVTGDKPTAWPAVKPERHASFVSVHAAGISGTGSGKSRDAGLELQGLEVVPGAECLALQTVLPRTVPNMRFADWTHASAYWRMVETDATRQAWLKFGSPLGGTTQSKREWAMEPGVEIRVRLYEPGPVASGSAQEGYLRIALTKHGSEIDYRAALHFPTLDTNQRTETSDGLPRVQSRPVLYSELAGVRKVLSVYEGGWCPTPGAVLALRVRVVKVRKTWLVVTGPGLSEPWATPITAFTGTQNGRIEVGHVGGMFAFHCCQLEYNCLPGSPALFQGSWTWTGPGPHAYPWVNPSAETDEACLWIPTSTTDCAAYVAEHVLGNVLVGSRLSSPMLYGVAKWVEPELLTTSSSPQAVTGIRKVRVTVNARRGHTCDLWYAKGSDVTGLQVGGVATVVGGYQGGTTATLFKGRVGGPRRYAKQGPEEDPPLVTLVSDDWRLTRKRMVTMPGTWAVSAFKTAFGRLLSAAGVATSRITTADDALTGHAVLMPKAPMALAFSPATTIDRALDGVCRVRGYDWWCTRLGAYYAGPKPTSTTATHHLDETGAAFLGFVTDVSHELATDGDFANSIVVADQGTDDWAAYVPAAPVDTPSDPDYIGDDYWDVIEGETSVSVQVARDEYRKRAAERRSVTWREVFDPSALLLPDAVVDVVAATEVDLAAGTLLRVTRTTWEIDAERNLATVEYEATSAI